MDIDPVVQGLVRITRSRSTHRAVKCLGGVPGRGMGAGKRDRRDESERDKSHSVIEFDSKRRSRPCWIISPQSQPATQMAARAAD